MLRRAQKARVWPRGWARPVALRVGGGTARAVAVLEVGLFGSGGDGLGHLFDEPGGVGFFDATAGAEFLAGGVDDVDFKPFLVARGHVFFHLNIVHIFRIDSADEGEPQIAGGDDYLTRISGDVLALE